MTEGDNNDRAQQTQPTKKPRMLNEKKEKAHIVVIGAGWWSQGWHLPHLSRNPDVTIAAIVDPSDHPKSSLNPNMESLEQLSTKYNNCPIYKSIEELFEDFGGENKNNSSTFTDEKQKKNFIHGAIVCTPHHTHHDIGKLLLEKQIHIFMEKPMSTNVAQARALHELYQQHQKEVVPKSPNNRCFLVNHSANYRHQAKVAHDLISIQQKIGKIRHISASMASPLSSLFNNPANVGWTKPSTPDMIGNGFVWGQSCHLIGWIVHVCSTGLTPQKVFCSMNHSAQSGADLSFSGTVVCENGINMTLSGTALLPGYEHAKTRVGKRISIHIYGDQGAILYTGDDDALQSGKLEYMTYEDDKGTIIPDGCSTFQFENTELDGMGPESLLNFIDACLGKEDYYVGADTLVGYRTVQIVEALYRSSTTGQLVNVAE